MTDPLGNPGTSTGGPVGAGADPAAVPEAVEEDEEEEEEDEEEDEEEEAGGGALKFPAAAAGAAGGRAPAGGLGTAGTGMDDARGGAWLSALWSVSSNSGAVSLWSGGGSSSPGEIESGRGLLLNDVASLRMSSTGSGGSKLSDSTTAHAAVASPSVTVAEPTCLRKTSHR